MPRGKYNEEIVEEIFTRMGEGELLTDIIRSDPNRMPSLSVISNWQRKSLDFAKRLKAARENQMHYYADLLVKLGMDDSNDFYEDSEGKVKTNPNAIRRQEFLSNNLKYLMERVSLDYVPKSMHHIGGEQVQDLAVNVVSVDRPAKETHEEWVARVQAQKQLINKSDDVQ